MNTPTGRISNSQAHAHAMKSRTLIILWLVLIALFSGSGFFWSAHEGQIYGEPFDFSEGVSGLLIYGGIGLTIATSLATGLYVIGRVRVKSLTKIAGIELLLFGSGVSALIPPVAMACTGLFTGENALAIYFQAVITVGIGVLAFVAFAIALLCVRRK